MQRSNDAVWDGIAVILHATCGLSEWIVEIFHDSRSAYGSRRIHRCLVEHGVRISRRRVVRIKQKLGLAYKAQRQLKVVTIDSNHFLPVASNHLNREFVLVHRELIGDQVFASHEEARQAVFEYIEVFYNRQRKHSDIGYMTPEQYDREFLLSA